MAKELAELLDVELNHTNIIPDNLRSESVRERLKNMMNVIEEALKFIQARMGNNSLGKLRDCSIDIYALISVNEGERITRTTELTALKKKLEQASRSLDSCLLNNIYAMVAAAQIYESDALLEKRLKPVLPARSSANHHCLEGTRESPLERIMKWALGSDNSSSGLYHVHGVAGSGKSSMASTTCKKLETEKILGGAFFCKRDMPNQRDPNRILPSLSYTLALRHGAYRACVMLALKDEPDITSRSIEQQLKVLFRNPFAELAQTKERSKSFVFVIDALDECGDDESRPRLADILCQIAALTNWLKVFVTSRPTNELMRRLSSPNTRILSINLNDADAEGDIKLYTHASLKSLVDLSGLSPSWLSEDTVHKLTNLASGLFIWTSTMIKYIRDQIDMDNAMTVVLSGKGTTAEASLDDLYMKVIESSGSGDDNVLLKKKVLGIVLITARNRPLSVDGLYDFLQGADKQVSKGTLVAVLNRLRSVLYEDISKGNVIRVCHPSFLDFLEDHNRSGMYWTSTGQLHAAMVETSLNLMQTKLRFNICGLKTSYVANKDVQDLPQKIKDSIPESLVYSCLYWTTHLTEINRSTVEDLVYEFFRCLKVVYWVEVLSLVDGLKTGLGALQSVMVFFNVCIRQYICYQSIYNSHLS